MATSYGIASTSALKFAPNTVGTANAFASMTRSAASYMTSASSSAEFNEQDRKAQEQAGA